MSVAPSTAPPTAPSTSSAAAAADGVEPATALELFTQRLRRLVIRTGPNEGWDGVDAALRHLGLSGYSASRFGVATVVARLVEPTSREALEELASRLTVRSNDPDVVIAEAPTFVVEDGDQLAAQVRVAVANASSAEGADGWARSALYVSAYSDEDDAPGVEPDQVRAITWDAPDPDAPGTYDPMVPLVVVEPSDELAALMQRTRRLALRLQREQEWCGGGVNRALQHLGLAPYQFVELRGVATLTARLDTTGGANDGLTIAGLAPLLTVESLDDDVSIVQQPEWVSYDAAANLLTGKVTFIVPQQFDRAVAANWVRGALRAQPYSRFVQIPRIYHDDVEVSWDTAPDPDEPGTYKVAADLITGP